MSSLQFVQPLPQSMRCASCGLPWEPEAATQCEGCEAAICVSCGQKKPTSCASCHKEGVAFGPLPRLVRELAGNLSVFCPHKETGCGWTGPRGALAEHVGQCKTISVTSHVMALTAESEFPTFEANNTERSIYAMAHLTAPTLQDLNQRKKPLAISAVIDVSGSMAGAKLNMAKDSLRFMVEQLSDRDYLGIIAFHSTVSETIVLTKMDDIGKKMALQAVESLTDLDCTNLSGGLFAGMDQVQGFQFRNGQTSAPEKSPAAAIVSECCRAVLIFTDGIANEGIQDEPTLKSTLQVRLHDSKDTVVHTFGFGGDHNANMLQGLAEVAGGTYYYIQDVSSMKESFADCLGGLLSTVAQSISLTAVAQPGFEIEKILTSFKVEVKNNAHVVSIKDLYSAEQRDILVRLKLSAAVPVGTARPLVAFSVEYDSLISGKSESTATVCCIDAADKKYEGKPNPKVSEQRTRVEATEAMEEAKRKADSGDVVGARAQLKAAKECMQARAEENESCTTYVKAVFNDMDQIECQMENERQWVSAGSKAMAQAQMCHAQQRMNCVSEEKSEAYGFDNAFKKEMRCRSRKA